MRVSSSSFPPLSPTTHLAAGCPHPEELACLRGGGFAFLSFFKNWRDGGASNAALYGVGRRQGQSGLGQLFVKSSNFDFWYYLYMNLEK